MYCVFKCEGMDKMEEKQGCEFCREKDKINNGKYSLYLREGKKLIFSDTKFGYGVSFKIKNCPNCGKKL